MTEAQESAEWPRMTLAPGLSSAQLGRVYPWVILACGAIAFAWIVLVAIFRFVGAVLVAGWVVFAVAFVVLMIFNIVANVIRRKEHRAGYSTIRTKNRSLAIVDYRDGRILRLGADVTLRP